MYKRESCGRLHKLAILKKEVVSGELSIVKHLQRDYKAFARIKREQGGTTDDGALIPPVQFVQLDEDLDEGTSQGARKKGKFYRYTQRELPRAIKKEEPEAEPAEDAPLPVPQPQQPANNAWLQQFAVVRPAKMLLRERRRQINYRD